MAPASMPSGGVACFPPSTAPSPMAWGSGFRCRVPSLRRRAAGCGWTIRSRGKEQLSASRCPWQHEVMTEATVHIVDDDDALRDSLTLLLGEANHPVACF